MPPGGRRSRHTLTIIPTSSLWWYLTRSPIFTLLPTPHWPCQSILSSTVEVLPLLPGDATVSQWTSDVDDIVTLDQLKWYPMSAATKLRDEDHPITEKYIPKLT